MMKLSSVNSFTGRMAEIFSSCGEVQQVDDRLAPGGRPALGNLVDLEPEDLARVGEEEQVVLGGGDEQLLDEILFLGLHAGLALAAAALGAVEGQRRCA